MVLNLVGQKNGAALSATNMDTLGECAVFVIDVLARHVHRLRLLLLLDALDSGLHSECRRHGFGEIELQANMIVLGRSLRHTLSLL